MGWANEKNFKDEIVNNNMATKKQLEALEKARARKRQLKRLREMRDAKRSPSRGYKKVKEGLKKLKKYRP